METPLTTNRLIRRPEVLAMLGVSRSTLYAWIERGYFERPVQLGPRAVAWRLDYIDNFISTRKSTTAI